MKSSKAKYYLILLLSFLIMRPTNFTHFSCTPNSFGDAIQFYYDGSKK